MRFAAVVLLALRGLAQDPAQLIEQGRPADAERALAAALRGHPDDVRNLVLMGITLDQQKRYADAEPYYKRALALAPREPAVLNNAGNHWLAMGQTAAAREAFAEVVAAEPRHANANLQLARIAVEERHGPDALRCLDRLPAGMRADPGVALLRARALDGAGRRQEAAEVLAKLGSDSSAGAPLNFSIGMLWAEWKRYEDAEQAFTRALAAEPANPDILYNLGLAAIGARHYDRAREVLGAVLRQNPEDVDSLYAIARSYAEAGNNEMALLPLIDARRIAPQRADVLEFIGYVSSALGYYGDAAAAFSECLKVRPDNDNVRRERGLALAQANRLNEGLADLKWYVGKHPKDPVGLFELALAESVRDQDQALETLNRALALKPDYLRAVYSRGALYLRLDRTADAIQDLKRVLEREPDNARALDQLGKAYLQMDTPEYNELAVRTLARAAELAPNDGKVLVHYGQALRDVGRMDEARAVLAKFRNIPEEVRRIPFGGMLDFLSLPRDQQRERYFQGLRKSAAINPDRPDLQIRLGNELLARRRFDEAIGAYRRAAAGGDPDRLAQIARTLLAAGRYAAAREFLEQLVAARPDAQARLDLAIATSYAVSPRAALEELEKMPAPDRDGDYFLLRAQILDRLGRFEDAVAALNQAFRAAPTRADLYFEASQFLLKHQRYAETIDLLEKANRVAPDAPELRLAHAIALELSRRSEAALKELAAIQERWPEWDKTYLTHGIILNVHRRPAQAREALETAIALGANTAEAYYFLALSIGESTPDDRAGARQALARALALNREDPYIRALAGKLAYADGDYKSALEHLQEAVRIFPNFFQAHYNMANVYRAMGDEERALVQMKEVRRLRQGRTPEELEMETPPLSEALVGR